MKKRNADSNDADSLLRLTDEMLAAAKGITVQEARYWVDLYYQIQEYRKSFDNQILSMKQEPTPLFSAYSDVFRHLEKNVKTILDRYSDLETVGQWVKDLYGFGPIISAGLLANIDINIATTPAKIWRFAGLDPTIEWLGKEKARALVKEVVGSAKGITIQQIVEIAARINRKAEVIERMARTKTGKITPASLTAALSKRPWNARLKVLAFKIGDCIVKFHNQPKSNHDYGRMYAERREFEATQSRKGLHRAEAERILDTKRIGKSTVAYKAYSKGRLPDGHQFARAKRWVVKLFLAHWHEVAYTAHYGRPPERPWVMVHGGHADYIPPPNWPMKG